MKLDYILKQLSTVELFSNYSGGSDVGGVEPKEMPTFINVMDTTLNWIYTTRNLKRNEVVVQQYDHIDKYYLDRRFAESNTQSDEPIKYIMDSIYEPFLNDVCGIVRVVDEGGNPLMDNRLSDADSIFTPEYNCVQVPFPSSDNAMTVVYRATHPSLWHQIDDPNNIDPSKIEVSIPPDYLMLLLNKFSSRYLLGRSGDSTNVGQLHNSIALQCAIELDQNTTVLQDDEDNGILNLNGYP